MRRHYYNFLPGSFIICMVICMWACAPKEEATKKTQQESTIIDSAYLQPYRLAYHFSPKINWMNNPNGLVYYEGQYHLYYQYNPKGTQWGNMSWGHAISQDLVHWKELPVAIEIDKDSTMIFSGSAVADPNSNSLCEGDYCIVAIYTARLPGLQNQDIAVSNDNGLTFQKYDGNPVIDLGLPDFRDPKVFWYGEEEKWVMVVALPLDKKIRLYSSENLINWKFLSDFGLQGDTTGIWECPDLFELPIENSHGSKWVMVVSFNNEEGSDMQYFVGDFDGTKFRNENSSDRVLTLDDGLDFYAAITWNNVPDNRRLCIGWFNNWQYARSIPTSVWRGSQSLVREFNLREFPEGIRLVQQPIGNIEQLRSAHQHFEKINVGEQSSTNNVLVSGSTLEIIAEFAYEADSVTGLSEVSEFGVLVFKGEGQETVIGYDVASQSMFVDRTNSGDVSFHEAFPVKAATLMPTEDYHVKMHIFIDKSSVEVFGNDGYKTMSLRIFPNENKDQVELYAIGGEVTLLTLDVWKLDSIWKSLDTMEALEHR